MPSTHIQFRATPELAKVLPGLDAMKGPQVRDQLIAKAQCSNGGSIPPPNDAVYSLAKKLVLLMVRAEINSENFDVTITDQEIQAIIAELSKEGLVDG